MWRGMLTLFQCSGPGRVLLSLIGVLLSLKRLVIAVEESFSQPPGLFI